MTSHNSLKTKVYILYHANCFDGTGAKYAAWKHFGDDATYIPVQYGQPFPDEVVLNNLTIVNILDFSYSREILEEVNAKVGLLQVLDHHKTAQAALAGLDYATFDMERSGAVMAWNYFFPGKEVPRLLKHVQDRDLWKFELTNTKRITAALPLLEGSMLLWEQACVNDAYFDELVVQGDAILNSDKLKISSIVKHNVKVLPYKGYKAGVYNTTTLISEVGNEACKSVELGIDFSMSYFIDKEGTPILSFRSLGDFDVSVLAKELGGGGHKNASGSKVTFQFLTDLYQGIL